MRLLGPIVVALLMYFVVPLLWQWAVVHKVVEMEQGPPPISLTNYVSPVDSEAMINAANPKIEINTEEYEQIAVRSQADQAVRQAEQAQSDMQNLQIQAQTQP